MGLKEFSHLEFVKEARNIAKKMSIKDELLKRQVNVGFSGGEKKDLKFFKLALLNPKLAILDETDSGLDVDALKIVSEGVNKFKTA